MLKIAIRHRAIISFLACTTASFAASGCRERSAAKPALTAALSVDLEAVRPKVEHFCGNCHAVPQPASFPKDRWLHEVDRGYEFYLRSGRSDLEMPPRGEVIEYFRRQAPDRITLPSPPPPSASPRFVRAEFTWLSSAPAQTGVAHILPLSSSAPGVELVCSDMKQGFVSWLTIKDREVTVGRQHNLRHPDHVCQTDLDADNRTDYLVADLGSFVPEDHDKGRVVWLHQTMEGDAVSWTETVLLDGVGRVADAQPADFDGDGDRDIVVAVFGLHATGHLSLLRREGELLGQPHFVHEILDRRTGAIHVPVADLNADGRPDFVALLSQEHESIEAFINRGDATFDKQVLFRAADPSYGSTGIELVDFDGDRDLDVLYTNGDSFDSFYVKPYHGIRWIENQGTEWKDHVLADLPGVHAAHAADLDLDGDLDVAACSFLPASILARQKDLPPLVSLLWLERVGGKFVHHEIERNNAAHAAMRLADVNQDGAIDIVAGNFGHAPEDRSWPLTIWLNQAPPATVRPAARDSVAPSPAAN